MNVTVERQVVTVETNALEQRQAAQINELGQALCCERCAREQAETETAEMFGTVLLRNAEIERKEAVIKSLIAQRDAARAAERENARRCDHNAAICREITEKFREFAQVAMDIEAQRDALRRTVFRLLGI